MTVGSLSRWMLGLSVASLIALPGSAQESKPPKKERNRISREELLQHAERFPDLYEAVRSLRPNFLAPSRGVTTTGAGGVRSGQPGNPVGGYTGGGGPGSNSAGAVATVWVDGRKSGEADFLKGIQTRLVEEVRYLTPNQALMEYGLGHEGGAIVVTLSKAGPPNP